MADGERRMLFDIRGRRKNVIKVVYAILAVMMGASLFLVVGPVNIGELLNTATRSTASAEIFDEQVERDRRRLRQDPTNEDILISLTRARINAGRAASETRPDQPGNDGAPPQARGRLRKSRRRLGPLPEGRRGRAEPLRRLADGGHPLRCSPRTRRPTRKRSNTSRDAADAQRFAAEGAPQRRRLDDPCRLRLPGRRQSDAAPRRAQEAKALARSNPKKKSIDKQLAAYRNRAKEIQKAQRRQPKKPKRAKAKKRSKTRSAASAEAPGRRSPPSPGGWAAVSPSQS